MLIRNGLLIGLDCLWMKASAAQGLLPIRKVGQMTHFAGDAKVAYCDDFHIDTTIPHSESLSNGKFVRLLEIASKVKGSLAGNTGLCLG